MLLACSGPALAQSDPTPHQVYEAARSGHVAEAEQMITQVLRDHPTSAEAHYVAAQVYARAGNRAEARQQLATAEQLKPGLPFVSRDSAQALQAELAEGPRGPAFTVPYSRPRPAGIPWGAIILVGAGIAVVWMVMRRRAAAAAAYAQYPNGAVIPGSAPPTGYGPGYAYGPGPGIGSGIAGGLASGLAVGAGVVAGEELARHFLDSDRPAGNIIVPSAGAEEANPNPDMGGNDFGVSDPGSWDDSGGSDSFGGDIGGGDWT
jgi:hypothetical protein